MLPVEEPFLGRVLLWVTALCLAGQDPTGAVHFLQLLSDPSCPAEGKAGLCQRTCFCHLEVHLWGSVSREQCFKGLSTNLPFGSRFSMHEQSSYRPQIACSSGHFVALPPSFLCFKWTFLSLARDGEVVQNETSSTALGTVGPFSPGLSLLMEEHLY